MIISLLALPRANRYQQPGCLYHLTHRCHDGRFLLRFRTVQTEDRSRLRRALQQYGLSLLAYCIASNHTQLLAESPDSTAISRMRQKLEGEFAEWYNLRKHRRGAFWSDCYHCTLVDGATYAWKRAKSPKESGLSAKGRTLTQRIHGGPEPKPDRVPFLMNRCVPGP